MRTRKTFINEHNIHLLSSSHHIIICHKKESIELNSKYSTVADSIKKKGACYDCQANNTTIPITASFSPSEEHGACRITAATRRRRTNVASERWK